MYMHNNVLESSVSLAKMYNEYIDRYDYMNKTQTFNIYIW